MAAPPTPNHALVPPAQTLSDPDQRATYDALAGFSAGGFNPFKDAAFERDQAFVDEVSCIGGARRPAMKLTAETSIF